MHVIRKRSTAVIFSIMILSGGIIAQHATAEDKIFRQANPKLIEAIMASQDPQYRAILESRLYSFKLLTHDVTLSLLGDTVRLKYEHPTKGHTLTRMNEWNREKGFSTRAFLTNDGVATLVAEIDFSKGITFESYMLFMSKFAAEGLLFDKHLN